MSKRQIRSLNLNPNNPKSSGLGQAPHSGVREHNSSVAKRHVNPITRLPYLRRALPAACLLSMMLVAAISSGKAQAGRLSASASALDQFVRSFQLHYTGVESLRAKFVQTYAAWGQTRVESGTVYLAQGGRMRWDYQNPTSKLFVSNGKQMVLYVPAEKQATLSPVQDSDEVRLPLSVLLSHLDLHKVFSRMEFAPQALNAAPGDRVLRGYPHRRFLNDYRSVLLEVTPQYDIRKIVVLYTDNTTMQFEFSDVRRNVPLDPTLFEFRPPAGTEVVQP